MTVSVTVTVSGVTARMCVPMSVCVYLITSEECVLVGSVLAPASVSLCEPRRVYMHNSTCARLCMEPSECVHGAGISHCVVSEM